MTRIESVRARQILDSRGFPTIEVEVRLDGGAVGVASAPSGASTGIHEAHEKRDGGAAYGGKGVLKAVEGVNTEIDGALRCIDARDQHAVDAALIALDATPNKERLGGNALIATSLAAAYAAANALGIPLYRHLGGLSGDSTPIPMLNVLNGGAHADNNIDIQEFMLVPIGAKTFAEAMRMGSEVYQALKGILKKRGLSTAVGDEGGFAPNLESDEDALKLLVEAIAAAGYEPGGDVALALDVASSEWQKDGAYALPKRGIAMTTAELSDYYAELSDKYPIVSIEDPLSVYDFDGFTAVTERFGKRMMIVGDDLFTTSPARLRMGIERRAANAILVKPNQIGTLSETLSAINLARRAGYRVVLSHRSGETESSAIADIAVAVNAEFLKAGAPARSERTAKYNRVLKIEQELLRR
jgi:enolase